MICVGIDVSKGKSTIFAMDGSETVFFEPREILHTKNEMDILIQQIRNLPDETKIVLEATGYYHWPVIFSLLDAGIFVSVVNPILMNKFSKESLRTVKTDKLDSVTIARYGLAHWNELHCCAKFDETYDELKIYARQYHEYMKMAIAAKQNLNTLLDKVMPDIQTLLCDEAGRSKLSDFAKKYWHYENISSKKESVFVESYLKWAKKEGYHANESKAHAIYVLSQNGIPTLPSTSATKTLVREAVRALQSLEASVNTILAYMNQLASALPEYEEVLAMKGVGQKTAPRLIAEIGNVRRFHDAHALVAYAGIDVPPFQSGTFVSKDRHITKRGSKYLRKVGYEIMAALMSTKPKTDNMVYLFICKKKNEGKYYLSAYMAGFNKFLRIYYARVKALYSNQLLSTPEGVN